MNIILWTLQILLALHTAMGAVWKFSNSEQSIPSLQAVPHGVWLSMSILELLCAVGLVLPVLNRSLAIFVPVAAGLVAIEMLMFCGLHLRSGDPQHGSMIYWGVVALVCALIAYGRVVLSPL